MGSRYKKGFIEPKRRENVHEAHRDIRDFRKIVIKQLLNNSIIKIMKTLISNTMLGKDSIFLMLLMLHDIKNKNKNKNIQELQQRLLIGDY